MPVPLDLDSIKIDVSLPQRALINSIEIQIIDSPIEFGFAFNDQGGVVVKKAGESDRICFSQDEIAAMKDCVLTHNHPRKSFFSREDIRYACLTDLQEIRVVAGSFVFILTRPPSGWDIKGFDTTFAKERQKILHSFRLGLVSETEANQRADELVQHVVRKLSLSLSMIQL